MVDSPTPSGCPGGYFEILLRCFSSFYPLAIATLAQNFVSLATQIFSNLRPFYFCT
ncbi:hypothetical protein Pr1d_17890 [Bythopirellula goksoeyrii]|uniref:Uncharacterized protein n=1 Tax=Bythopirellula goksoeyrii TaxID=1400387 RepID=A0A5B9Q9S7_9BACT|nr:hypothetical protein Pr1d_17890 [Bythopirellula goksoeyrii]